MAACGRIDLLPCLLGTAVLFWTAGFDLIYACQDIRFDRGAGLRSIPERWGVRGALRLARIFHVVTVGLLAAVGLAGSMGWVHGAGVAIVAALLVYEHSLVRPDDLSRVNQAFFTMNGLVSLVYLGCVFVEKLIV